MLHISRSAIRLISTFIALMLASLCVLAAPVLAVEITDTGTGNLDGKVVVSPAAEVVNSKLPDGAGGAIGPGVTATRNLIVLNRTDKKLTMTLDVAQVVGSTADLIVEVRHGVREGAAAWVKLETPTLTLKPGQQAVVKVTITLPKNVKPGSKSFAVTVTQQSGAADAQGGAGIAPQFKQDAIYIVDLPGDAPIKGKLVRAVVTSAFQQLQAQRDGKKPPTNSRWYLGSFLHSKHRLTLSTLYKNTGDRLLEPSGRVVVRDVFGRVAARYTIPKFRVYPEGEAAGQVEMKKLPSLGIFQAKVTLESAAGKQVTTMPRFAILPWWFVIAITVLVGWGLLTVVMLLLRRRRAWHEYLEEEDAIVAVGDADHDGINDVAGFDGDDVSGGDDEF